MPTPLLRTKLFVPPVPPELVSRSRLLERFEAGLHRKLTIVSAPAGFGKTTLLSEWAHHRGQRDPHDRPPIAWVSLDNDDSDSPRFWIYFIAALQTIRPEVGTSALPMLQTPKPPPIEPILTRLINDVAGESEDLYVVLDDYHAIEDDAIHSAMTFLLDHMPSQLHLIIASRLDPPLPLSRLRGRGQLNEIGTTDLRFTLGETETFFNGVMHLGLSDENLAAMEDRTEGWIASLQMAAISMKEREDISSFISAFSGSQRHILDYLTEEVLNRQPADIRSFLMETSVLNRLGVPLCDAVTGRQNAREKLAQLETAHLFLVPLDDERRWFRYHHLFSDLLRNQLGKTQPNQLKALHRRASEWFEREGLIAEAVDHALAAEEFERAAKLIEAIAVPMITMESKVSTLTGWLRKLPDELITRRPWLCISLASAYLAAGQLDAVEPVLQAADASLSDAENLESPAGSTDHSSIRGLVMALRANAACVRGDMQHTLELCHNALKQLPDDETIARCPISLNLGVACAMRGELQTAGQYLKEAIALGQSSGNLYIALIAMGYLAEIQARQGLLHRAAEMNRQAIRLGAEWSADGEPLAATSFAHISMAKILYQWNDLEGASHHMSRGIELSRQAGDALIVLLGYHDLILLNEFLGKTDALAGALTRAKSVIRASHNAMVSSMADAWQARLSVSRGDLAAAERWAASLDPPLSLHDVPDPWLEFSYLTLVRLHIARGELDGLSDALERLWEKAESGGRTGNVIEILILQSIALKSQRQEDRAVAALERALSLAEPEGYIRTFVDEGGAMKELLRLASARGFRTDYVGQILLAFETPSIPGDNPETPASTQILSPRELEVLKLMADGASSKAIASELIVSVSTVKKHIKNIYRKLDVHKQTTAVTRAQELGLL